MSKREWKYYCEHCGWNKTSSKKIPGIVGYLCKKCNTGCVLDATENIEVPFSVIIEKEAKTVGQLAYKNSKKFGNSFIDDKYSEFKHKRREAAKKTAKATGGKLIDGNEPVRPPQIRRKKPV